MIVSQDNLQTAGIVTVEADKIHFNSNRNVKTYYGAKAARNLARLHVIMF